jgi:O-succinylbenzoic acid--CoA ligase
VAIDLPQDDTLASTIEQLWNAGDAVCILDPLQGPAARRRALATMRPTILLDASGRTALPDGAPVEPGDALVIMSSGSTADPKAAIHSFASLGASARATSTRLGVDPSAHGWLCCLPTVHIGGFSVIARALLTDTSLHVLPRAEPAALHDAALAGSTHVSLVATMLARIDPTDFACIVLGGAAPPAELPDNVVTTYGLTETGSGIVYDGLPLDGVELDIAAPDDQGFGEILIKSPTLLRSYRDRALPQVGGSLGNEGWFPSGDLGRLTAEGRLEVRGRIADVIMTGAEKVYPADVEAAIAQMAGVREVAVWKRPDLEWGERVVAWVVPDGAAPSLEELRAVVRDQVAAHAAPKELVLVDVLPRSALGKLQRHALD